MTRPRRFGAALTPALALLLTLCWADLSVACTIQWKGGEGDWHNPLRWTAGDGTSRIPDSTDHVCITSSIESDVTVSQLGAQAGMLTIGTAAASAPAQRLSVGNGGADANLGIWGPDHQSSVEANGSLVLNGAGDSGDAHLFVYGGGTLTNRGRITATGGFPGTVQISGTVSAGLESRFVNNGVVDVSTGLLLATANVDSAGAINVAAGATLDIDAIFQQTGGSLSNVGTTTVTQPGTFIGQGGAATGNPIVLDQNTAVAPGGAGTGAFRVIGGNVQLVSDVGAGYALAVTGTPAGAGRLFVGVSRTNSGAIWLTSDSDVYNARLEMTDGAVLTNAKGAMINVLDSPSPPHELYGDLVNRGGATFTGDAVSNRDSSWANDGTLTTGKGVLVEMNQGQIRNFTDDALAGGTWIMRGKLRLSQTGRIKRNDARVVLDGRGSAIEAGAEGANVFSTLTRNLGGLELDGGGRLRVPGTFVNAGDVAIEKGSTLTVRGNYTQMRGETTVNGTLRPARGSAGIRNGELLGKGTIAGDLHNRGTVRPGTSPGTLNVKGDFTQARGGTFVADIQGYFPGLRYDRIVARGRAELGGKLKIVRADDFDPRAGRSFDVVVADRLVGRFDRVEGRLIGAGIGRFFDDTYESRRATLEVKEIKRRNN